MKHPTAEQIEYAAAMADIPMSRVFERANVGRESFYRERRGDGKMLLRTALKLQRAVEELGVARDA